MCCAPGETSQKPVEGCQSFYFCFNGTVVGKVASCRDGLLFDAEALVCNHEEKVTCVVNSCHSAGDGIPNEVNGDKSVAPATKQSLRSVWPTLVLTVIGVAMLVDCSRFAK